MTTATRAETLGRDLEEIAGAANVIEDPAALARFAIDAVAPRAAVSPADAQEVAAVLRYANERKLCVVAAGGLTHQHTGQVPESIDILLRTERLKDVEHYDAGDLTIGIGAGATIQDVRNLIEPHRQILPLHVTHPARATVGGALAVNAQGPMKHGFGGLRDYCIGIRFVTADGKIAKAGGRVVKNVAGYDLMKLLIGSYGTLAMITGASFKLFPAPRKTRTYVSEFANLQDALAFRTRILRSPLSPVALELVSPHAQVVMTGDAGALDIWRVLLRASASDAVLARYRAEIGGDVAREAEGAEEEQLWHGIYDFEERVFASAQNTMLVRLDLPATEVSGALTAAVQAASDNNFVCAIIGRVGIGALLVAFCPIAVDPPGAVQYANTISFFRSALGRHASAVVLRCPAEAKRHFSVWGTSPTDIEAMKAIKMAMDPNDVLNRGRFVEGVGNSA